MLKIRKKAATTKDLQAVALALANSQSIENFPTYIQDAWNHLSREEKNGAIMYMELVETDRWHKEYYK